MDEIIDLVLGRSRRDRDNDGILGDLFGVVSRWVRTCGCLLVLAIVGSAAAILGGLVTLSSDQVTIIIVFITMIFAVISLIRTGMGY